MINYLKAKKYKGIDKIYFYDLNKINVLCGKNNSGKTSTFEALCAKDNIGVGQKVDSMDWMIELFEPEARKYSNPSAANSRAWFSNYIKEQIESKIVWFSDENESIRESMLKSLKVSPYHKNHRVDGLYNFDSIIMNFFKKRINYYKPILIPPKRNLEIKSNINFNQNLEPNGNGIMNTLFYLKNQDISSIEYKKFREIYDHFKNITGYIFNIIPNKENYIELLYFINDKWFSAADCGLGLTEILILLTIIIAVIHTFIFIEEPENHLHADYQKRLLQVISSIPEKQFFISTHSSIFLDSNIVNRIFYVENKESIVITDQTSRANIVKSLGYSVTDNIVSDLVIFTEGPTDVPVLKEIFNWIGLNDKYQIKYWPLGGDIMAQLDLSVFAERKNVVAIIDRDPGSQVIRTRFKKKCDELDILCTQLSRYSIENYFTLEAIRKVFPEMISSEINTLNENVKVDEQIGFDKNNKTIKSKSLQIIKEMSLDDIRGTDLFNFVEKVKDKLEEIDLSN